MSDAGEAQKGVVPSRLAAILVEDDVQGPVQVILDAPTGPYGEEDRVWIRLDRGNEEPVSRGFPCLIFLSIRLSVIASSKCKPLG